MKEKIRLEDYANEIMEKLPKGVLLSSACGGKQNVMTIGWGALGIDFGVPVFYSFVRTGRATAPLIMQAGEFTVCIPHGDADVRNIIGFCGSHSARDTDKIAALGLTVEEPETVSSPAFRELPLTLECKAIHAQEQALDVLPEPYRGTFYPQDVDGSAYGANRDPHIAFCGRITAAYLIR